MLPAPSRQLFRRYTSVGLRVLITLLLLTASCVWLIGKPWRVDTQIEPAKVAFLFTLANSSIDESSGVAVSRRERNLYWTHNDSGGKAELHAFDNAGRDKGEFTLQGVTARDWEDIASVQLNGKPYLYVGDIGDNMKNQSRVRVLRIVEPPTAGSKTIAEHDLFVIKYPDGSHNCETLMVGPNGDIFLVTKDDFGHSSIYRVDSPQRSGDYAAVKVGELKLSSGNVYSHMVTGGDISADGRRVVIRTYFSILLFETKDLSEFWKSAAKSLPVPLERQGEAICFDESNNRLLTTSEGSPCRVSSVTLPR